MSTNVPEWVGKTLATARQQKIDNGRLIPGRERFPLTPREQEFLQDQIAKQANPLTAEAVVFDSLDKLNNTVGRR